VLKETKTNALFILSCWHVLKDDTRYDGAVSTRTIIDEQDRPLADLEAGGIWGPLDYGLARCKPNAPIQNNKWLTGLMGLPDKVTHREIDREDTKHNTPLHFFDVFAQKKRSGVLYGVCSEVQIEYRDGKERILKDILVIIESTSTEKTISQPGNSGAMLFDDAHKAIGMIVAGDDNYTYAIKISNILNLYSDKSIA
jgi:hypothetical protein